MKTLFLLATILTSLITFNSKAQSEDETVYFITTASLGYKFDQSPVLERDSVDSAGYSHPMSFTGYIALRKGNWETGVKHDSQPFEGWPVNTNYELHKTEVYVSYTWKWALN